MNMCVYIIQKFMSSITYSECVFVTLVIQNAISMLPIKFRSVVCPAVPHFSTLYIEIKCQLDATDEFLLQILLLAQHVSGTIMPIIRSSRVLYRWLLPVVFGDLVFKLSEWCGAEGCVSRLRAAAAAPDDEHNGARNMLSKQ